MGEVFLRQGMVGAGLQAGVVHPGDLGVAFQEPGQGQGVLAMPFHAEVEGFHAQHGEEGVEGHLGIPQVPDPLGTHLGRIGALGEIPGVDQAVVTFVRLDELREFPVAPVKVSLLHNGAAHAAGMPVQVFCGGVGDDVRPPLEGLAEHGGGEGVVHNQGDSIGMGHPGEFLDVQDHHGGVAESLREDGLGVGADGGLEFLLRGGRQEVGEFDAALFQGVGEEADRAAVEAGAGHHVVPRPCHVQDGVGVGGLARGGAYAGHAPLQGGQLLLQGVHGGIGQAGVKEAGGLQVEEVGDALGVVVFEGGALDDGADSGLPISRGVSGLDGQGFLMQAFFAHGAFLRFCRRRAGAGQGSGYGI